MSDNPKHVTVRLRVPPELRDKIAESSEQYNRSMNADMVARLEDSFERSTSSDQELEFLKKLNDERSRDIQKLLKMVERLLDEKKAP